MTIEELKANKLILFEVVSGSRAFGLATRKFGYRYTGCLLSAKDSFLGLDYIPQVSNETNDITYYEIGRFMELLQKQSKYSEILDQSG